MDSVSVATDALSSSKLWPQGVAVSNNLAYALAMAKTDKKVGDSPGGKWDDASAEDVAAVESAFHMLEGRWKMVIVFHLFEHEVLRFSELERAIPGVSQKMLIQQLRDLERDGGGARRLSASPAQGGIPTDALGQRHVSGAGGLA
jgi:DNA-binding HxlR family transcriptional regulator